MAPDRTTGLLHQCALVVIRCIIRLTSTRLPGPVHAALGEEDKLRLCSICFLLVLSSAAVAGAPREEIHAGVRVTFQCGADASPTEIIEVARAFVDALNHQDTEKALRYVQRGQKETWRTYLTKKQEKHDLTLGSVLVFIGNYKTEGKRLRDQLMARIKTRGSDGIGGMSFLMLFADGKWVIAID